MTNNSIEPFPPVIDSVLAMGQQRTLACQIRILHDHRSYVSRKIKSSASCPARSTQPAPSDITTTGTD